MAGKETPKTNKMRVRGLVQQGLAGFHVEEMTEIVRVDVDGRRASSEGFLRNQQVAETYRLSLRDPGYSKTEPALVLTNGHVGFLLRDDEEVNLLNEPEILIAARKAALAKLSPEEQAVLGFHSK